MLFVKLKVKGCEKENLKSHIAFSASQLNKDEVNELNYTKAGNNILINTSNNTGRKFAGLLEEVLKQFYPKEDIEKHSNTCMLFFCPVCGKYNQ